MPNIDPKVAFWFGLFLCLIAVLANGGETILQGTMSAANIMVIVAWAKALNGLGTALMTYIAGTNMTQAGRIQNVQQIPLQDRAGSLASNVEVAAVVLKNQSAADANPSSKVIGPEDVKKAA